MSTLVTAINALSQGSTSDYYIIKFTFKFGKRYVIELRSQLISIFGLSGGTKVDDLD